jgi:dsRNA-specific ribonuclease
MNRSIFEVKGDLLIGSCFVNYLSSRYTLTRADGSQYESFDAAILSNLNNFYQTKDGQGALAKKFGLIKLVRIGFGLDEKAHIKILGDLFESIIGAIFESTNVVTGVAGSGYVLVSKWVKFVYDQEVKEEEIQRQRFGAQETQLKEMFEKMKWGKFEITSTESNNQITATIKIPSSMKEWFSQNRANSSINTIRSNILARGTSDDEREAKRKAIESAFNTVLNGIKDEKEKFRDPLTYKIITAPYTSPSKWARDLSNEETTPELESKMMAARAKAKNSGYEDIDFQTRDLAITGKSKTHTLIVLYAVKDSKRRNLVSDVFPKRNNLIQTNKIKLLDDYLKM